MTEEQYFPEQELEEQRFLQTYDAAGFEHPSVTVDILIFTVLKEELKLLLIKRASLPFKGKWAIPGGFLRMEESAEEAAARRIREEAGVEGVHLEQLYTFSAVDRDPRTRVISIAYLAAVPSGKLRFGAGVGAAEAALFAVSGEDAGDPDDSCRTGILLAAEDGTVLQPEDIAFDHMEIIRTAVQRMRGKLSYTDLAFDFLEDQQEFTLTELRHIHEAILDRKLDVGNFRRRVKRDYEGTGRIREARQEKRGLGRPAMLYSFHPQSG